MKIKLTESQIKKLKLITEGYEVVNTFMEKADEIKDIVNRMYSKLTFTTLAEIIDGEIDLGVMTHKLEQLRTVMYTYSKKAQMFFENIPQDKYDEWEDLHNKFDDKYQEVLYHKIDILEELINSLEVFVQQDIKQNFTDIVKTDL